MLCAGLLHSRPLRPHLRAAACSASYQGQKDTEREVCWSRVHDHRGGLCLRLWTWNTGLISSEFVFWGLSCCMLYPLFALPFSLLFSYPCKRPDLAYCVIRQLVFALHLTSAVVKPAASFPVLLHMLYWLTTWHLSLTCWAFIFVGKSIIMLQLSVCHGRIWKVELLFGKSSRGKHLYFCRYLNFMITQCTVLDRSKEASLPKTSLICPDILIEHWLVTDKTQVVAITSLAQNWK